MKSSRILVAGSSPEAALKPSRSARTRIGVAVAAALAGAAATRGPAFADTADAAAAAAAGGGALQEVVVTARKVVENIQDVPISINVLTSQDLQNLGVVRFDDFAYKVPSMTFNSIGPGTPRRRQSSSMTLRSAGSAQYRTSIFTIWSASRC